MRFLRGWILGKLHPKTIRLTAMNDTMTLRECLAADWYMSRIGVYSIYEPGDRMLVHLDCDVRSFQTALEALRYIKSSHARVVRGEGMDELRELVDGMRVLL